MKETGRERKGKRKMGKEGGEGKDGVVQGFKKNTFMFVLKMNVGFLKHGINTTITCLQFPGILINHCS